MIRSVLDLTREGSRRMPRTTKQGLIARKRGMTQVLGDDGRATPVTVLEAGSALSEESRASTFHPPTLDMLDALGASEPLIAQGLKAPQFQYRSKRHGLLAQFDFSAIADATALTDVERRR